MEPTIMIISTRNGMKYARKIGKEIFNQGGHYRLSTVDSILNIYGKCPEGETLVHSRVAYPYIHGAIWLANLVTLKSPIINEPQTLMLTSNKLACNRKLKNIPLIPVVESQPFKDFVQEERLDSADIFMRLLRMYEQVVIKPIVSSGGKNVFLFDKTSYPFFRRFLEAERAETYFVQPYIPLMAMRRVIVIDGVAMDIGFEDTRNPNDDWKLSVCMNPNIKVCALTKQEKSIAERVQKAVGGVINFIDLMIAEKDGRVLVSEVNTSCNLSRHDRLVGGAITSSIASCLIRKAKELL